MQQFIHYKAEMAVMATRPEGATSHRSNVNTQQMPPMSEVDQAENTHHHQVGIAQNEHGFNRGRRWLSFKNFFVFVLLLYLFRDTPHYFIHSKRRNAR